MKKILLLLASAVVSTISAMDRDPLTGAPRQTPGAVIQERAYQILQDANSIRNKLIAAGYADIANKTNLAQNLAYKSTNPEQVLAIVKASTPDTTVQFQIAKVIAPDQIQALTRMEQLEKSVAATQQMWR